MMRTRMLAVILASAACGKEGGGTGPNADDPDAASTDAAAVAEKDAGPDPTPARPCPTFADKVASGTVDSNAIPEASGIVASRKNPGVLWVHNDSGNPAEVFAMTTAGKTLATYAITGAKNRDWEDMAIGPGSTPGEWDLFLGDIGDNDAKHKQVQIYRVPEPVVDVNQAPVSATLAATTLPLVYPDGPHNAESLVFDPRSSSLFIVTKAKDGESIVFEKPAPHEADVVTTLTERARVHFGTGDLISLDPTATGADISPDGSEIVIKTYTSQFLWRRGEGQSVGDALRGTPCPIPVGPGEAVGFSADARAYYTVEEGLHPTLYRFDRK